MVDPFDAFLHENFAQSLNKLEKAQNQQSNAKKKAVVKSLQKSQTFEEQNMSSIEKEVELIMLNKEQLNLTPAKSVQKIADKSYAESRGNLVLKEMDKEEEEEKDVRR